MYNVPHSQLTLVCMSYSHSLNERGILGLLGNAYHDASLEIEEKGPGAFIGQDHSVYSNSHLGVAFSIHAMSDNMCWVYFRLAIIGLQQIMSHWGAIKLEYEVHHEDYGSIAEGSFEGIRGVE